MKQNQVIKLELTPAEVEYVLDSLSLRPWREVNDLIVKISTQYRDAMLPKLDQSQQITNSSDQTDEGN